MTLFNNDLYFAATNAAEGQELWRVDHVSGLAAMVTTDGTNSINPGTGNSAPYWFTVFNNDLYFGAYNSTEGTELWRVDHVTGLAAMVTTDGTHSINPGTADSTPYWFTVFNNDLYFTATNAAEGQELWRVDHMTGLAAMVTTDGTNPINPGAGSSGPGGLTVFNNDLYFAATNAAEGRELWQRLSLIGASGAIRGRMYSLEGF